MSKIKLALIVAVVFAFQVGGIFAQTLGKPGEQTGKGTVILKAARIIDGTGKAPIKNGLVVIEDNKITAVGTSDNVRIAANAKVIDLGDATIMPGFIDAHTHIIGRVLGDSEGQNALFRDYDSFGAILAVGNAQKTLMAGFTTIRNVGAANFDDLTLRKAINEGWIVGPRMLTAGHSLGITGGHCDENGYKPGMADGDYKTGIADGVDQVRAAVRYQIKYGADLIKTCATGGVLSEGDAVGVQQYSFEEMKAMVDEAKQHERKVAAHAHGTEGIKVATRAGVASIEHGSFLDVEGAKLMKKSGTFLVPTLMAGEAVENLANKKFLTGLRAEKSYAAANAMRNMIKIAVENNLLIALGTDSGVIPHGTNGHEFTLMVNWGGMKPLDAITAGTLNGAKLLGLDKTIGSLEVGKYADIVVVKGNPLENIKLLENVDFVMKNGVVYKGNN
ncbi:MAG: amidohydrolase family protein [Acidobacteriota bacterium]|jgi:imidazolonepropionase-like amidohydrolase|nr:amidohydrolase family protein [Acidobacteriota bacterium]